MQSLAPSWPDLTSARSNSGSNAGGAGCLLLEFLLIIVEQRAASLGMISVAVVAVEDQATLEHQPPKLTTR